MPDYMLTVYGGQAGQPTDVLIMDAADIREACTLTIRLLRCEVDHGRQHHTHYTFDPGVVIDATTEGVEWKHRNPARTSLEFARPAGSQKLSTPRGA